MDVGSVRQTPQGSVSSLWTGVEQVSLSPAQSWRPGFPLRGQGCVDRWMAWSMFTSSCPGHRLGGAPCSLVHGFRTCNTSYSVLGRTEENVLHQAHRKRSFYPLLRKNFWRNFSMAAFPEAMELQIRGWPTPSLRAISASVMPSR